MRLGDSFNKSIKKCRNEIKLSLNNKHPFFFFLPFPSPFHSLAYSYRDLPYPFPCLKLNRTL